MFNSQRDNNINVRYISYPRQNSTELPHHSTRNTLRRSDSTTTQNSSRSTSNQITRLVRRLITGNRNSSGSNTSSSRSSSTRTQTTRTQSSILSRPSTSTPATLTRTITSTFSSSSSSSIAMPPNSTSSSTEPEPFPFHNPWSIPQSTTSSTNHTGRDLADFFEQEYSPSDILESTSNLNPIQSLNIFRPSSRPSRSTRPSTPSPRPLSPSSDSFTSNINAIQEYFNIIPFFHDPHSNNNPNLARSSRRRLSNSSYHSIDHQQPTTSNQSTSNDITMENNFHDPFNNHRYLAQNHSSRETFCFLSSKLQSNLNNDDNYENDDYYSSSERNFHNNYEYEGECEQQEQQKVEECYLCLESLEFRGGRMIINPGCGHLLHMKCYLEYIKYFKEQCTLCKKDFGSLDD